MNPAPDAARPCLPNHPMALTLQMQPRAESARAAGEGLDFASCVMSLSRECLYGVQAVVSLRVGVRGRRARAANNVDCRVASSLQGHGGHLEHALQWFGGSSGRTVREVCPTGCGKLITCK